MALELVCGADFWCNRHCRTSPVVLEGFGGQVWPKTGQKQRKPKIDYPPYCPKFHDIEDTKAKAPMGPF